MGKRLASISGALFCLSLVLPALAIVKQPLLWGSPHDETLFGMHCLALGFFFWPAWLANPLMLFAWIFFELGRHNRERFVMAAWLAGCALVAALLAPWLLANGGIIRLRFLHVGYYAWVASIGCLLVASVSRAREPTYGSRRIV